MLNRRATPGLNPRCGQRHMAFSLKPKIALGGMKI
jgi:hypothetical protein